MSRNSLVKVSFYVLCVLIGLLSAWALYKIYVTQKHHKDIVDKIIGIKPPDENDELFMPLVNAIDGRFKPIVDGLSDHPQSYQVKFLKTASETQDANGDWISYEGASPSKVNYGAANFSQSYPTCRTCPTCPECPPKRTRRQVAAKRPADAESKAMPEENKVLPKDNMEEQYASEVILSDIILVCTKNNIRDYDSYSNLVWKTFFPNEVKSKYMDVGKIFVGSENSLAVFPYRAREYKLDVKDRDWWKAAYGVESGEQKPKDFYDLLSKSGNAGLTIIYPDIVSTEGTTDLNRTIWYKFNKYGKRFVLGIDLRLADFSYNVLNEVRYELIALGALCLLFPFVIYARGRQKVSHDVNIDRIYKILRVRRQRVTYNAGQQNKSEITSTLSVRNMQENKVVDQSSWQFNFDAKPVKVMRARDSQRIRQNATSDLIEVTLKKTFDLSLKTGNLKAVELWNVCRPSNDSFVLGVIEVLWQNNRNTNDITLNQVYWDSNTSASLTDILKELKRHLQTSEGGSFIIDQGSVTESEPDIVNVLKDNLQYVKDFAAKFESFSSRALLFDNNIPILEEIYSTPNCHFFATCSIQFLDNLKQHGKLKEILDLKVDVRYIIDGKTRKFSDFYNSLDDELKQFIESLPNLSIIDFQPSRETIYLNRDFCIMSFGQNKCVLYTDMSDERAQKGWISWREVDVDYYDAIREFIESGDVQKRSVKSYLGKMYPQTQ